MVASETAISRVVDLAEATPDKRSIFLELLDRTRRHVAEWETSDARQVARIDNLKRELHRLIEDLSGEDSDLLDRTYPWRRLTERLATGSSEEMQELVNSLIMEPYGELVDSLAEHMTDAESPPFDPRLRVDELIGLIEQHYAWALEIDFTGPKSRHFFWCRSAEKEEPRLGERGRDREAEIEMRFDIAYELKDLHRVLLGSPREERIGQFLFRHPGRRFIVSRVQTIAHYPYGEIHGNLIDAQCCPVDVLRCKLSFFGAVKFDPKSDRWTRITMYQGAPGFAELAIDNADSWVFPVFVGERPELHA